MPNNPNRVGFRNLTRPLKALLIIPTILSFVLLIWVILLQGAVSNLATSTGEFLMKKFSLDEAPINADFGFDLSGFGWLGTIADYIWSPGGILACVILFLLVKKYFKKFTGPRRNRRPAAASTSSS